MKINISDAVSSICFAAIIIGMCICIIEIVTK